MERLYNIFLIFNMPHPRISMKPNAIIIGAGPAGISAAIYLVRAGFPVTVVYRDMGALGKTDKIENFYGFPEPVSGPDLFNRGIEQAKRLGVTFIQDEVVGLVWEDKMTAVTQSGSYPGDVIVLATGAARIAPKIDGLKELEGRGVSYCAICDAFFYRGKDVGVIGAGDYAKHEAITLAATSRNVTIFTMGKAAEFTDLPSNVHVETRPLIRLNGTESLESVELDDHAILPIAGIFVAVGIAGSADFARKIGAQTDGVRIVTDDNNATTLPGLYACGDCTGGMLQVAKAVYEGARAATHAVKYLRTL